MDEDNTAVSLDALAAGDEGAWAAAYDALFGEIWKVLRARLLPGFGVDWDDLACEIISGEIMPGLRRRRTRSFAALRDFPHLLTLARVIAARRSVDVIRRVTRRREQSLPQGGAEQAMGAAAATGDSHGDGGGAEQAERFLELIHQLNPPKPELFVDHFWGGLTYAEIGENRDMPLGTVCSHFNRGLKQLKTALETKAGRDEALS